MSAASEIQKKTQPTKLKVKNKLPERNQNLKKITNHSYAVRALKSYIEVSVNADEVILVYLQLHSFSIA